jgi:hypothetical protein
MNDKKRTEYAIKQIGDRYYPVIIDKEAGVYYEIKGRERRRWWKTSPRLADS